MKYLSKNSIAFRLFITILTVSLLILTVLTSISTWTTYQKMMYNIEDYIKDIETIHIPVIIEDLWAMDTKTVKVAMEGLIQTPFIKHVSIEKKGEMIMEVCHSKSDHSLLREFPLFYTYNEKKVNLGVMKVYISKNEIYHELRQQVLKELLFNTGLVFLIAFFMYFLFMRMVTQHLTSVASYLKKVEIGNLQTLLRLKGKKQTKKNPDEIDQIVTAINSMQSELNKNFRGLQDEIKNRKQIEEELKVYQENLEKLVEERTAELKVKNKDLEQFNDLFVGREFRIKELRVEVENLKEQIINLKK